MNVLFPFLAFMVEDMGYGGERLGFYAGMLAASFCAAQFTSSIPWGIVSDMYGRKPAILVRQQLVVCSTSKLQCIHHSFNDCN